jgi:hypothetical protein
MKILILIYAILCLFFSEKIKQLSLVLVNITSQSKQLFIDNTLKNINTHKKTGQSKTDSIISLMSKTNYVLEDSTTGLISCDSVNDTVLLFKNKSAQKDNLYLPYTIFVVFSRIGNQNNYHVERNDNILSMNFGLGKQRIDTISAKCIIENRDLILQAHYNWSGKINEQIRFKHEQYSRDGIIDCKENINNEYIYIDHDGLIVKSIDINSGAKIDLTSIDVRFSHFNHTELSNAIFSQTDPNDKKVQQYGQKEFDKIILQEILNNKLEVNSIITIKTKKIIERSLQKYIYQNDFFTDEFFKRNLKVLETSNKKITREQLSIWYTCLEKLNFEDEADPNLLESNFLYPLNKLIFAKKILTLYKQSDYGDAWNQIANTPKYQIALQMMYATWSNRKKMYTEIDTLKSKLKKDFLKN